MGRIKVDREIVLRRLLAAAEEAERGLPAGAERDGESLAGIRAGLMEALLPPVDRISVRQATHLARQRVA
jgi:hypothetical protein